MQENKTSRLCWRNCSNCHTTTQCSALGVDSKRTRGKSEDGFYMYFCKLNIECIEGDRFQSSSNHFSACGGYAVKLASQGDGFDG